MPVESQPRLTARPLCRPSQPPPPPPIKAPKPEVGSKGAIIVVRDGSTEVADTVKVSGVLHEDRSSRPPTSQKQNFPQQIQNSSTKLKGSGSPLIRKPAPPVPTKPAHLQRNCLTPPPKPGNLSSVLGLSSYSLPEYELSDLEHPQLSSTLISQVLPRTHFLSKAQTEAAKTEPEHKPPKLPVRRESMKMINDMGLRESKRSSMTVVSTITSLEESFITRFRPVCDFPAPEVFTSCEKTYPSREQGSVAKSESEQLVARASLESEDEDGGGPVSDYPPPPLPSTAPPTRSISYRNITEHIIPVTMTRPLAPSTVPPPPPLPLENINIPAVKPSGLIIPPPPPLPSPVTCTAPFGGGSTPVVQASTPINHSQKELLTCAVVDDSPISVTSIVKSGFADNLAKLYGSVKRTENCFPDEPPPLAAKPKPYPVINKKPALVKSCGIKMAPPPQRPPSLIMRQPHTPINTSSSPTPAISSPVSTSKTKTSPVPKPPRSAPPPPPPAPFRTSSLSTTPPAVLFENPAQALSRSLSVRSAPPPPVPAHSSDLDRSHSLRTSSTSSPPLTNISEQRVAAAAHPESITRKYSFRAAPPPPQSLNPTESPGTVSSSQGSSRLGGPMLQSPKLLIC